MQLDASWLAQSPSQAARICTKWC